MAETGLRSGQGLQGFRSLPGQSLQDAPRSGSSKRVLGKNQEWKEGKASEITGIAVLADRRSDRAFFIISSNIGQKIPTNPNELKRIRPQKLLGTLWAHHEKGATAQLL